MERLAELPGSFWGTPSPKVTDSQDDNFGLICEGSTNSAPISGVTSARLRSRYQSTIAISENTKMIVEMALISGVMPRRSRPQISRGSVLSRPIRKKLTATSSMEEREDQARLCEREPEVRAPRDGARAGRFGLPLSRAARTI